jgi:hypothetical protein
MSKAKSSDVSYRSQQCACPSLGLDQYCGAYSSLLCCVFRRARVVRLPLHGAVRAGGSQIPLQGNSHNYTLRLFYISAILE